jgi:hypothetical protein
MAFFIFSSSHQHSRQSCSLCDKVPTTLLYQSFSIGTQGGESNFILPAVPKTITGILGLSQKFFLLPKTQVAECGSIIFLV